MLIAAGHQSYGGIYTAPIAFSNTFAPIVVVTDECLMTTLANDFVNNQIMTHSQSSKLRKRAKKQALQGVASGSVQTANDRKVDKSTPGIFQAVLNKIGEVAHSILHTFDFLNQNFLKFPSAAAEELNAKKRKDTYRLLYPEIIPDDFSSEQMHDFLTLVEMSNQITNEELAKALGKITIPVMGATGAGKGRWIVVQYSDWCLISPSGIRCENEVVNTSAGGESHTKYIQVVEVNEKLKQELGKDVVFVDTPGLYDKRENSLESLVYSLMTSKAIHHLRRNRHVNVYLMDFPSYIAIKGAVIAEIREVIEQPGEDAKLLVVSKVRTKDQIEDDPDEDAIKASKEKIKSILDEEDYSETSINKLILYDVADRELALSCVIVDEKFRCDGRGGSNRQQTLEMLRKEIGIAQSSNSKYIIDSHHQLLLNRLRGELALALEKGFESCSFERINRKYEIFQILLKIEHPALDEIQNLMFIKIDDNIVAKAAETLILIDQILAEGNPSLIDTVFHNLDRLNCFKQINFYPNSAESKINEIVETLPEKCKEKILLILSEQSSWENEDTQKKMKAAFELVKRRDEYVKQKGQMQNTQASAATESMTMTSTAMDTVITPAINALNKEITKKYYEYLWGCDFTNAKRKQSKFDEVVVFLNKTNYSHSSTLKAYKKLEEDYTEIKNAEFWNSFLYTTGTVVLIGGTWYISGPALLLIKGATTAPGFAALATSAKIAAISKALGTLTGVGTVACGTTATAAGIGTVGDIIIDQVTDGMCQSAWLLNNFAEGIPLEFLPKWLKQIQ